MLSLKRQLQATGGLSEASHLTSSSLTTSYQPLSSYSLYGETSTSPSTLSYTYPSTLGYYGNSSYTSSYTYGSQQSHGGLLLRKSEFTNQSPATSSYGLTLTTTSDLGRLNFGYSYQTSITTTSPSLTSTGNLVTTETVKNKRSQVTMDTMERTEQHSVRTTEATLALPELIDTTEPSSQVQPKLIKSQG